MPVARIQMADGRVARFEVPEGTTPAQAEAMARAHPVAQPQNHAKPTSFWQGVNEGVFSGVNNAETALEAINPLMTIPRLIAGRGNRASRMDTAQRTADASPTQGSGWGRFAGEMLSSAPTMALPGIGGAGLAARILSKGVTQGAASGALLSNSRNVQGVARDTALGAGLGKGGELLGHAAGRFVGGRPVSKNVRLLADEGVTLTPGMRAGPKSTRQFVEDKVMGSVWPLNLAADSARARTENGLRRAAANRFLAPIGESVPDGIHINHDSIGPLQQTVHDAYDAAAGNLSLAPDEQLLHDLAAVHAASPHTVLPDEAELIAQNINHTFDQLANGPITGEALKSFLRRSRTAISKQQGGVADQLTGIHDAVASALERQNSGGAADAFNAAREAETLLARFNDAASRAGVKNGEFGATHLKAAVDKVGYGTNASNKATGTQRMGDLANAAYDVMGNRTANSGTPGRAMALATVADPLAALALYANPKTAIPMGASMLGYIPGLDAVLQHLALNRPEVLQQAGRVIEKATPLVSNAAVSGFLPR